MRVKWKTLRFIFALYLAASFIPQMEGADEEVNPDVEAILAARGRKDLDSAHLEIRLVYVNSNDLEQLKGLKSAALADKILTVASKDNRAIEKIQTVIWAGQFASLGIGYIIDPEMEVRSKPYPPYADHLQVSFTMLPDVQWGVDSVQIMLRCTCYAASSMDQWWRRDNFHTSFVTNILCKTQSNVVIGDGIQTYDKQKVLYPLVKLLRDFLWPDFPNLSMTRLST
jgi:hypothetical protein